ncbi:MAG: hypothetical protein M3063_15980 [Actinomycetota bacterium]|nr:hypothetical protein [Actinomycetota bacterium]
MADDQPGSEPGSDWTVEVVHRIDTVVGTIRQKTILPITKVARAVVFGLVAAVAGVLALALTCIVVVRISVAYLPFDPVARRVWVTYAVLGAIFLLGGAFAWRKRKPARP